MKIRYLALLAMVSSLSLGAVVACANPCASKTATTSEVDPCASKGDPCASKADPCASKADPCASKNDPCASKGDPCAGKTQSSIGGPLAAELHGKPVVVDVFATWCSACENIAPTLSQLKEDYEGEVNFVVLDVSDRTTTAAAEAKAKELGLKEFLKAHKAQTGTLTIIEPETGKILTQHRNNPSLEAYTTVLDTALN